MSEQDIRETETLRFDVFQALYEAWVEGKDTPERFVGLQGDTIVVVAKGGRYFAITVVPANVAVNDGSTAFPLPLV